MSLKVGSITGYTDQGLNVRLAYLNHYWISFRPV